MLRAARLLFVLFVIVRFSFAEESAELQKSSAFEDSPAIQGVPAFDELKSELSKEQAKHARELKAAQKALGDASDDAEKQAAQKHLDQVKDDLPGPKIADRFLEFAKEETDDARSFAAAMTALKISRAPATKENTRGRAITFLQNRFATKPQIGQLVRIFEASKAAAGESLLREVLAKNPNHRIQGRACKALAQITTRPGEKERLEKLLNSKFVDMFPDLSNGKRVPEIVARDLEGNEVKLSDFRGQVVVLDFWATWCPHCRAMFPQERKLVETLKHKPFAIVSISMDEKREALVKLMEKEKLPWTNLWVGSHSNVADDWNIEYFPTIFVIDDKGIIREQGINGKDLDEAVDRLLKKMESRPIEKKKK